MIRDFTPRLYQQTILGTAASKNTLVVLPTGMGKTALAFLLAAQRLHHYPQSKILLLSPTKPLCEQHVETFQRHLEIAAEKIVLFTGNVPPEKRAQLWKEAQVIISTPQGLENDLINKRVLFDDVSLLIFDEAHHATGDYAYVWLADQYEKCSRFPRILALTASPGSDLEKVKELCKHLHIERVEVRTEKDPDVEPYVQDVKINWVKVPFPEEFKKVQKYLQDCKKSKLLEILHLGFLQQVDVSRGELLHLQGELAQKAREHDFEAMRSLSLLAEALKVEHGLELLESQGTAQLFSYLEKMRQESTTTKVKAVRNLFIDQNFKSALFLAQELAQLEHPKLLKLQELLAEQFQRHPNAKVIIFTQFRDSAEAIVQKLQQNDIAANIFVGQAKKNGIGFSQKQQKEILDKFRNNEFAVLVATSVAEEGLDIPNVDKVLFYEPVPSAIRSIQRRGRTGRLEQGEVTILVTAGTRDEAYRWAAHHKEKRMHRNLEKLRTEFAFLKVDKVSTLSQFIPPQQMVTILADHREKDNKIVKELIDLGVSVKTVQLEHADYIVGGKVGVELKKVPDFVASIIDGRLLDQVHALKRNFEKAVLVVEGEEDIYSIRQVHPNAIRGMLASIVLDFAVPVLYTKNPRDTAALLAIMAKREQGKEIDLASQHKPKTLVQQQEYFIAAIPQIGMQYAQKLLATFGSIKNVINASAAELEKVEGIGKKTAARLQDFFAEKYKK